MPAMSGAELARLLRERVQCSMTKLVALTGYSNFEGELSDADCAFDCKFIKPVSLDALADILRRQ
jgi:CheY-like chemotaxis protein